tara:strand:+ start:4086 stop:4301 length:216 start_codon:yes stop_codon:yes gene_type:complete
MKPFIIIDLPMNHHEPDCTFCIKPGFVLTPGKPRYGKDTITCLHDGIHNNGGWPIALPIDELRKLLMEAFQ